MRDGSVDGGERVCFGALSMPEQRKLSALQGALGQPGIANPQSMKRRQPIRRKQPFNVSQALRRHRLRSRILWTQSRRRYAFGRIDGSPALVAMLVVRRLDAFRRRLDGAGKFVHGVSSCRAPRPGFLLVAVSHRRCSQLTSRLAVYAASADLRPGPGPAVSCGHGE